MATENLQRAFADTRAVIANIKTDQLDDPTPCASWKVRDIMNHVIGGSFYFAECASTGKGPGGAADVDVTTGDFVATYDEGIAKALTAFGAPGVLDGMVELPFGTLPMMAWLGISTTDTFTHGWDLASATGQSTDIDPDLAVQLLEGAKQFIQPAFRGEDTKTPFGPEQTAPPNASEADKLAAFLGRRVGS